MSTLQKLVPLFSLLFLFGMAAYGQHGYRVTKRVTFKKGEVASTITGALGSHLENHEYILRAREGQTLKVELVSNDKNISFLIIAPNDTTLDDATNRRGWTGELTRSGDYRIIVSTTTRGHSRYRLRVQIATDI
jgi:hypothetical protein